LGRSRVNLGAFEALMTQALELRAISLPVKVNRLNVLLAEQALRMQGHQATNSNR
jgi:hypothetical protein